MQRGPAFGVSGRNLSARISCGTVLWSNVQANTIESVLILALSLNSERRRIRLRGEKMTAWSEEAARAIIRRLERLDGALLPILHALQDEFGYVDADAVAMIAEALNLSRAEVYGAISFYHDFRQSPAGGRVIKICRAEACQANGCEDLLAELHARRGLVVDGPPDEKLAIETVYCLGNCALGPNALVDGRLVARLDSDQLAALCDGGAVEDAQAMAGTRP